MPLTGSPQGCLLNILTWLTVSFRVMAKEMSTLPIERTQGSSPSAALVITLRIVAIASYEDALDVSATDLAAGRFFRRHECSVYGVRIFLGNLGSCAQRHANERGRKFNAPPTALLPTTSRISCTEQTRRSVVCDVCDTHACLIDSWTTPISASTGTPRIILTGLQ